MRQPTTAYFSKTSAAEFRQVPRRSHTHSRKSIFAEVFALAVGGALVIILPACPPLARPYHQQQGPMMTRSSTETWGSVDQISDGWMFQRVYPSVFVRRTSGVRILQQLLVGAGPTPPSRHTPMKDPSDTADLSSRCSPPVLLYRNV